ncbi:TPA: M81 family peptidase [Candidatus Poribacteria bacterium]|nr:M81 family peptidase [Candidatus Poribacteria bacterium]
MILKKSTNPASHFRVAVGQIYQETNSFSSRLTGISDFRNRYLVEGSQLINSLRETRTEIGGFLQILENTDVTIIPTVAAWAMPGGRVEKTAYELLSQKLLQNIQKQTQLDGVLLSLHGAMLTENLDDADGQLLEEVRQAIGPDCYLVVSLDWHANLTDRMLDAANIVVGYKTYPHQDLFETGQRAAFQMLAFFDEGKHRRRHVRRLPLIAPVLTSQSERQPMKNIIESLNELEREYSDVSASLFLTQPWLDISDFASTAVLYFDESADACDQFDSVIDDLWNRRDEFLVDIPDTSSAIDQALSEDISPVIVVDLGDVVLAGAPGTSTKLFDEIKTHPARPKAVLTLCAPELVSDWRDCKPGCEVYANIPSEEEGDVTISGRIERVSHEKYRLGGSFLSGVEFDPGTRIVLQVDHVTLVLTSIPESAQDPNFYTSLGIDLSRLKIIVVKSHNTFKPSYAELTQTIKYADTPGSTAINLALLPYEKLPRPLFPLDKEGFS